MNKEIWQENVDKITSFEMLDSVMEECSELIKACSKVKRSNGFGLPTNCTPEQAMDMLVEELGDVMRCCDMIRYKFNIDIQEVMRNQTKSDLKIANRFKSIEKGEEINV